MRNAEHVARRIPIHQESRPKGWAVALLHRVGFKTRPYGAERQTVGTKAWPQNNTAHWIKHEVLPLDHSQLLQLISPLKLQYIPTRRQKCSVDQGRGALQVFPSQHLLPRKV